MTNKDIRQLLHMTNDLRKIKLEGVDWNTNDFHKLNDDQLEHIRQNYRFANTWDGPRIVIKREHIIEDEQEMLNRFMYELDLSNHADRRALKSFVRLARDKFRRYKTYGYISNVNKLNKRRIEHILKPSFHDFYGEENVEFRQEKGEINVFVKYGDTTISNLKKSHPIKDLYLKFTFRSDKNREAFGFNYIGGLRTTLTRSESRIGYQHSHLPHISEGYLAFCLGASQVGGFYTQPLKLDDPNNYEILEEFLITVDHLVQFEDIGNPYKKISSITPLLVPVRDMLNYGTRQRAHKYKEELVKYAQIKVEHSEADNVKVVLQIKSDEELLSRIHDELKAIKSPDGYYYEYVNYMSLIEELKLSSEDNTVQTQQLHETFKGEQLKRKIVPDNLDSINMEPEIAIHPGLNNFITKHYQSSITNIINDYVKNKTSSNQEATAKSS